MNKNDRRAIGLFLSGVSIVSAAYLFQNGMKNLDEKLNASLKRQIAMYDAVIDYALECRLYREYIKMIEKKQEEIKNHIIKYLEQNAGREFEMIPDKNFFDRG